MMYRGRETFFEVRELPIDYKEVIKDISPYIAELQLKRQFVSSLSDTFHFESCDLNIEVIPLEDHQIFDIFRRENLSFSEIKKKYANVLVTVNFIEPHQRLTREIERTREVERIYETSY